MLSGHADFLTALTVSVVAWHGRDDRHRFCAVRRGVLSVSRGSLVAIPTREALVGDDLERLEHAVLAEFRDNLEAERTARNRKPAATHEGDPPDRSLPRPERPGAFEGGARP
jgi:F-type H+-transporting ATPase subunit epsilon